MIWFYLFGRNANYPEPLQEIHALSSMDRHGDPIFLKLSPRDDAPLKGAVEGDVVCLCTREQGRWSIHGEAEVTGPPVRGEAPASMRSLYPDGGNLHWWRGLARLTLYPAPKSEEEFDLAERLPILGQAHVVRRERAHRNGRASTSPPESAGKAALELLTQLMTTAHREGRLEPEAIAAALRRARQRHPYGL